MDPVATVLCVVFAVLWVARGIGLLREWLELRATRSALSDGAVSFVPETRRSWTRRDGKWVSGESWPVDPVTGNDESGDLPN